MLSRFLDAFEGKQSKVASQGRSLPMGSQKREYVENQAQMSLAAFSHRKGMPLDWIYTRDSSGGEGATIFVPDSGAAIDGPAWQVSH